MRVVVDTCGWIEWFTDGMLASRFEPFLIDPSDLLVPTIVQYELHRWVCRERDEAAAMEIIGVTGQAGIIALDTSLALFASELATIHSLAMADAVVYASAQQSGAELVTCDDHFSQLEDVRFFAKRA